MTKSLHVIDLENAIDQLAFNLNMEKFNVSHFISVQETAQGQIDGYFTSASGITQIQLFGPVPEKLEAWTK